MAGIIFLCARKISARIGKRLQGARFHSCPCEATPKQSIITHTETFTMESFRRDFILWIARVINNARNDAWGICFCAECEIKDEAHTNLSLQSIIQNLACKFTMESSRLIRLFDKMLFGRLRFHSNRFFLVCFLCRV